MSLNSDALVISTSCIPLATDESTQVVTTVAGQVITANPTAVHIGSSTLTPGSLGLTLGGTLISLNPAGQLVIDSKTIPLDRAGESSGRNELIPTVAGQVLLTAESTAVGIIGRSTLTPDSAGITLSVTMISLDSSGKLMVRSRTFAFQSSTGGLGGLLMGGFSSREPNVASPGDITGKGVQAFQGNGKSLLSRPAGTLLLWLLCACPIRLFA